MIDLTYKTIKRIIMKHLQRNPVNESFNSSQLDMLKKWRLDNDKYVYRRININSLEKSGIKECYNLNEDQFKDFIKDNFTYGILNGASVNVESFVKITNDDVSIYKNFCYDLLNALTEPNQNKLEQLLVSFSINIIDKFDYDLLNKIFGINWEYTDLVNCIDAKTVAVAKLKTAYLEENNLSVLYNPSKNNNSHCLIIPNEICTDIIIKELSKIKNMIDNFDKNIDNIAGVLRKIGNKIVIDNDSLSKILTGIISNDVFNDINTKLNVHNNYAESNNGTACNHSVILSLLDHSEFNKIISNLMNHDLSLNDTINKNIKNNINDFNYQIAYINKQYKILKRNNCVNIHENHYNKSFKDFLKSKGLI